MTPFKILAGRQQKEELLVTNKKQAVPQNRNRTNIPSRLSTGSRGR